MTRTVAIDCLSGGSLSYREGHAVVAVDVIRATTTAVTAVAEGRQCFPVHSLEAAYRLARELENAVLAGELDGVMPPGFDMNNSPADLVRRGDRERPLVLLSSSGTKLLHQSRHADVVYLACFRNAASLCRCWTGRHARVAIVAAASRGEFRIEDQICSAWIAAGLINSGYRPADGRTAALIELRKNLVPMHCLNGASARYLRSSGQARDLEFIVSHINDLDAAFVFQAGQVVRLGCASPAGTAGD